MSTTRPERRPVVVLIGFMGAGKSTVGRILADRLGVDFLDTDAEVVRSTGRTIPDIFTTDGAERFREIERDVVLEILGSHGGVLALGGGAVMTPAVAAGLAGHRVVYLKIDAEQGFARVRDSDRPLIAGDDPHRRYGELLAERDETYLRTGTFTVDAAAGDPGDVADAILAELARALVPERAATT
ncbi:shikimate kinase [Gordonia hankookensis]|uniref:Shikimate kinase n=1 Tax=Gordonia hankookensis TaxID=589403 RepID=A0ABR7WGR7_9ACTN|nr:shikimate kinase [Gordonia hankookensis]MBD1321900.1 shikimate kinase [Gordonia hankookensis]NDZ95189.1 shikimate kinase [Streptomyces sp. SID11726]NEB24293.1 shikimate kinase [Streptomyces sp. SID6673]